MATYPSGIYEPRTKNNKEGVEYVAGEDTTLFAEDVVNDDNEIVAIETELGTDPSGIYATVKSNLVALWLKITNRGINIETLSDEKTLTPGTDKMYQYLDEGGANRIIYLATEGAIAGDRFIIRHNGSYDDDHFLNIKQAFVVLEYIYAGGMKEFVFDGTNWISGGVGTAENDNKKYNLALGYAAKAQDNGVAIGYNADANFRGVAVGVNSKGYTHGAAVGRYAYANDYGVAVGASANGKSQGVAIGYQTNTNENKYSVVLGMNSQAKRFSEIAHNINGSNMDQENNITIIGLEIETENATPIEMLSGGQAGERVLIRASSVLAFTILISARDNVSGDCAAYKVEGAIKRDGSNNTSLLTPATITPIHEDDASWDVAITADDTNEALVITVTGDADNIVQWAARLDGVETHF